MLKKEIKYVDYDGNDRKETFYFNLSKPEIVEMQFSTAGGLTQQLEKIVAEQDQKRIIEMFKALILQAYGEKSPDGKRFIKSKELSEEFSQTEAYTSLFMELATNAESATEFIRGIIPKDLNDQLPKELPSI